MQYCGLLGAGWRSTAWYFNELQIKAQQFGIKDSKFPLQIINIPFNHITKSCLIKCNWHLSCASVRSIWFT